MKFVSIIYFHSVFFFLFTSMSKTNFIFQNNSENVCWCSISVTCFHFYFLFFLPQTRICSHLHSISSDTVFLLRELSPTNKQCHFTLLICRVHMLVLSIIKMVDMKKVLFLLMFFLFFYFQANLFKKRRLQLLIKVRIILGMILTYFMQITWLKIYQKILSLFSFIQFHFQKLLTLFFFWVFFYSSHPPNIYFTYFIAFIQLFIISTQLIGQSIFINLKADQLIYFSHFSP